MTYDVIVIRTICVSELMVAWVGCEKGTICKFGTNEQFYIERYGFMHNPKVSTTPSIFIIPYLNFQTKVLAAGMKFILRRRETQTITDPHENCSTMNMTHAHSGSVSCIFCKDGLVISAGGSSRTPELVFWNENSHTITQFRSMHSLSKFGTY